MAYVMKRQIAILHTHHDNRTFVTIYDELADRILRYFAVRVGSPQIAEDLAAQTFLKVLEAIRKGKCGENIPAWVFGIARYTLADYYRRHRNVIPLNAAYDVAADGQTLEEIADHKLRLEQVAAGLQKLTPERAEALALRFFGGLSTAEVAEVLGKSPQAVKMLVYRAVQDLKSRIGESDHD